MTLTGGPLDFVIVFLGGVLVSFTPCVYPLLPIIISSIAGSNTQGTRRSAFFLSWLYVLGMALTYSTLAALAALSGQVFGSFQNSFAIVFGVACAVLFFSLIMLEIVTLPYVNLSMPVAGQRRPKSKMSVFLMGLISGFAVGPCTAPVLGTLLLFVASRHNVVFGVSLLFTFAIGMGLSVILAGMFSGFLAAMPRSDEWMVKIKKLAGFVLMGLAVYYFVKAGQLL